MKTRAHAVLALIQLAFICARTISAVPLLSIDFNSRTNDPAANTYTGFTAFLINSNASPAAVQTNPTVRTVGSFRLTLTGNGINPGYTDRAHPLPTNTAAFTQSLLLRDCVYSPDTSPTAGLNLLIENLPASNRVLVTVWSFDAQSSPVRASDWFANGALARVRYEFTNSVLPTSNEQCRFSFKARVSTNGQLLIQGRRNPASVNQISLPHAGVFLNALQIDPEPLEIVGVEPAGGDLKLTFVVRPQPGQAQVEEFVSNQWRTVTGVVYGAPVDNLATARFARPTGRERWYRIRYPY